MVQAAIVMFLLVLSSLGAEAEGRFALLIGNQNYNGNVGPLKNPHNDIALVGNALERLGFKLTIIRDAGYRALDTALRVHIQTVRRAGRNTISFVYYSGHGAADPDTRINYLIPTDVETADDASLWTNSFELRDVINKLRNQSPEATHYVVFDACREELRLTLAGKKAFTQEKGFVPVPTVAGVMVAYATAPGKAASDGGQDGGAYAKALAKEIVRPGVEAVTMFRNVQLEVKRAIGQDPWLSFPALPAVYLAGEASSEKSELTLWMSVKDSTDPAVLATYLERYPNGEFGVIARALMTLYEQQNRVHLAKLEQERKQREEARRDAELKRLEEERRTRELADEEERHRAEASNNEAEIARLEKERAVRAEELRKLLEEARSAREEAKAAEQERLAALKAAEEATKAAEDTIAKKREAVRTDSPAKIAALPKLDCPNAKNAKKGRNSNDRNSAVGRADQAKAAGTYQRCMGARTGCYGRAIAHGKTPEQARAWCNRRPTC